MTHGSAPAVELILGLLVAVAIVAAFVRFVRVPYTIALVVFGLALALAPNTPRVTLTPAIILTVFLPVLLFHAAYNLDLDDVRLNLLPVTLLAVPGVIVTAGLVGVALRVVVGLPWSEALLFGTIVGATDPVAVLAIFGEVGAPRRLATIVNTESLFNDGTALVLFGAVLGVVASGAFDAGATVERFIIAVVGSLALGGAVGVLGSTVLQRIDDALLETAITLIMAYGGFLLADNIGISGPLETATAGLLLGARGTRVMSPTTRLQARATWEFLDFLANSLLFLLVGLALRPIGEATLAGLGTRALWPLVVAIVAMTVARAVVVWAVMTVQDRARRALPRRWRPVLTWAGLRGAVSLAAGLSLPATLAGRPLLLAMTFGTVLFTLLAQGLTIRPLMAHLGLGGDEASRFDFELAVGRLRAVEAAARELDALRRDDGVDEHLAQRLAHRYAEQRDQLRAALDTMYHSNVALSAQEELEVERRLLRVQRQAIRDAYARGLLSAAAERELASGLDRDLAQLDPVARED
jgi:CPA1 family monovalent cation:H+ antiporter